MGLRDGRAYHFQFLFTPERPDDAVETVVTAPDGTATRLGQHRSVAAAR